MSVNRFEAILICGLSLLLFTLTGCGGPKPENVDPNLGMQTLRDTLDQWVAGENPETLASGTPEVIVQDMDWSSGLTLLDYETMGDGEAVDANLRVQVKLHLRDQNKKDIEKLATYVVTTRPKMTVFRDMFN